VERHVLHNTIQPLPIEPISISKDKGILESLAKLNEGNAYFQGISPSALNSYIECRLKFYFQYIAKIKEPNEVEEDIDARVMGNFLHNAMELFYKQILERKKSKEIDSADLENIEAAVDAIIEDVFIKEYNLEPGKKVEFEGQRLVVKEVVKRFALKILKKDKAHAPFSIEAIEQGGMLYKVKIDQSPGYVLIGGKIDRVGRKDDLVRVIDYKTGKDKLDFESVASLFIRDKNRNKAAFQTILYALLYRVSNPAVRNGSKLVPGLMNRTNLFDSDFQFGLKMGKEYVTNIEPLLPEFEVRLKELLEELFNPEGKFDQTDVMETCRYCSYKNICHR
jgi:ATP-dependent helicase/DNAse subunit B